MSELEILEKSTNIQRTDFYLVSCVSVNFQEKKTYDAPMKPSVLFCYLKNSFSYTGAVLWNSLPAGLRQAKTLESFKAGLR